MPLYKCVGIYRDNDDGLTWSISNVVEAGTVALAKAAANTWNTAYLTACGPDVRLAQWGFGDMAVYRNWSVYPAASFTTGAGLGTLPPLPDGNGLLWVTEGDLVNQGSGRWLLHGISTDFYTVAGKWATTNATLVALDLANAAFLQQFRKDASPVWLLPPVNPPEPWLNTFFRDTPYIRRLGRPFLRNGQTRRYQRARATP